MATRRGTLCGGTLLALLAALSLPASVRADEPARPAAATTQEVRDMAHRAQKAAQQWAISDGKTEDKELITLVNSGKSYDESDVAALKAGVDEIKRSPATQPSHSAQQAYALTLLLAPLQNSPPKVIQQAMPAIKAAHVGYAKLDALPPDKAKAAWGTPELGHVPAAQQLEVLEGVDQRRQDKLARETQAVRRNAAASGLESLRFRLMYLADDPKEDEAVVQAIFKLEGARNNSWSAIVDMLNGELKAGRMPKERAKRLYSLLRGPATAKEARWAALQTYTDYTQGTLRPSSNSQFRDVGNVYFRGAALELLNNLGQAAGEKPITVPPHS